MIYEKTHRKHHHGLAHCIESAYPVDTDDIGVVLRALSALRTQRYDRRHCGKKDKQRKRIRSKAGYGFGFRVYDRGFDQIRATSPYPRMAVDVDRRYRYDQDWKRSLGICSHEKTHIPSYRSE